MLPSEYIHNNKLAILSTHCLELIDKLHDEPLLKGNIEYQAYILATIRHETAHTYLPIAEYGRGRGHPYGNPDSITGQTYYGRGYVQLTWKRNYEQFSKLLNVDLVNHPDLAMQPDTALKIITIGMVDGLFTGRKLSDYITPQTVDYYDCRRIVNGIDQAQTIANFAEDFEKLFYKVYPNI